MEPSWREYIAAIGRAARDAQRLDAKTAAQILVDLQDMYEQVVASIASGGALQNETLPQFLRAVEIATAEYQQRFDTLYAGAAQEAVTIATTGFDGAITAGSGTTIAVGLPRYDRQILQVAQAYYLPPYRRMTTDMRSSIESEIRLATVQAVPPKQVAARIKRILLGGQRRADIGEAGMRSIDKRATAIARTELARVAALATQNRFEQMSAVLPDMKQKWVTAGDELVCPICAPLNGRSWKMGDKRAPTVPKHSNCRCRVVPWRDAWGIAEPVVPRTGYGPSAPAASVASVDGAIGDPNQVLAVTFGLPTPHVRGVRFTTLMHEAVAIDPTTITLPAAAFTTPATLKATIADELAQRLAPSYLADPAFAAAYEKALGRKPTVARFVADYVEHVTAQWAFRQRASRSWRLFDSVVFRPSR